MDFSADFNLTVSGRAAAASRSTEVFNPADGKPFAKASDSSAGQFDESVASAKPDTVFAGRTQSSFGAENCMGGLLEYMVPQAIYVARP